MKDLPTTQPIARVRTAIDALVRRVRGGGRTVPPPRAEVGTALDAVNDAFHEAYDAGRTVKRRAEPVFVVLADSLVFFHGDRRTEYAFSPRAFHLVKSVAHAPVALFALREAARSAGAPVDPERLAGLHAQLAASLRDLDGERDLAADVLADCRRVLEATREAVDRLRAPAAAATPEAFAESVGPELLRLVRAATALQLAALHAHTESALRTLGPDERATLEVVVTGDHQARARSLGMQYFCKRLGESRGADHRVTYAEGVSDEASALALIGTRRLDRKVARAFFGDAQRLQRDVLGDAAHELLAQADLKEI